MLVSLFLLLTQAACCLGIYTVYTNVDCYSNDISSAAASSTAECLSRCDSMTDCVGVLIREDLYCWLKRSCNYGNFVHLHGHHAYITNPGNRGYDTYAGKDCYGNDIDENSFDTFNECLESCNMMERCAAVAYLRDTSQCYRKHTCDTSSFDDRPHVDVYIKRDVIQYTTHVSQSCDGNDVVSPFTSGGAHNLAYCMDKCYFTEECVAFAFYHDSGTCHLKQVCEVSNLVTVDSGEVDVYIIDDATVGYVVYGSSNCAGDDLESYTDFSLLQCVSDCNASSSCIAVVYQSELNICTTKSECKSSTLTISDGYDVYIPDCYKTELGTEYRGTKAVTINGYECQRWDSQSPHSHSNSLEDVSMGQEENYCRNPDETTGVGPWCYTTDPDQRWESCGVSTCPVPTTTTTEPTTTSTEPTTTTTEPTTTSTEPTTSTTEPTTTSTEPTTSTTEPTTTSTEPTTSTTESTTTSTEPTTSTTEPPTTSTEPTTTSTEPTTSTTEPTSTQQINSNDGDNNNGNIEGEVEAQEQRESVVAPVGGGVGGAIGLIALLALLIAVILIVRKKLKSNSDEDSHDKGDFEGAMSSQPPSVAPAVQIMPPKHVAPITPVE